MDIRKKNNSFNMYTFELSYGEMVAIENALSNSHSGPLADELWGGLRWYLDKLPGPGEEEKDKEEDGSVPDGMGGEEFGGGEDPDDILDDPSVAGAAMGGSGGFEPPELEPEEGSSEDIPLPDGPDFSGDEGESADAALEDPDEAPPLRRG